MKIAVVSTTRGRPSGIVTTLQALDMLRGKMMGHEVRYFVRVDDDDTPTLEVLPLCPEPTEFVVGPRTDTLGESWNAALGASKSWDWDAVTFFPDDVIPLTPLWDHGIDLIINKNRVRASCWTDTSDPQQPSYFILSRDFLEALGGYTSTEFFPFWFDDTWVSEVYKLAYGHKIPIVKEMCIGGFNDHTTSMWDLKFWVEFWIKTRDLRVKQAAKIRKAFKLPTPDLEAILASMREIDRDWYRPNREFASRIERIEATRGEAGERTPRYLRAKARAEDWLAKAEKPSLGKKIRGVLHV